MSIPYEAVKADFQFSFALHFATDVCYLVSQECYIVIWLHYYRSVILLHACAHNPTGVDPRVSVECFRIFLCFLFFDNMSSFRCEKQWNDFLDMFQYHILENFLSPKGCKTRLTLRVIKSLIVATQLYKCIIL